MYLAQEVLQKTALSTGVVAAVMLAARLFGRQTAGVLAGLPIITAPALWWVAIDQGREAATRGAVGSVAACSIAAVFCLCYDRLAALRAKPSACLAAGAAAVACATLTAGEWLTGLVGACAASALVCGSVLRCLRPAGNVVLSGSKGSRATWPATLLFAAFGSAMATRGQVDPFWVGLLAGMPIVAATVAISEHASAGPSAVTRFLRGYVAGLLGRAAFGLLFALLLQPVGPWCALMAAITASAVVSATGVSRVTALSRPGARTG